MTPACFQVEALRGNLNSGGVNNAAADLIRPSPRTVVLVPYPHERVECISGSGGGLAWRCKLSRGPQAPMNYAPTSGSHMQSSAFLFQPPEPCLVYLCILAQVEALRGNMNSGSAAARTRRQLVVEQAVAWLAELDVHPAEALKQLWEWVSF